MSDEKAFSPEKLAQALAELGQLAYDAGRVIDVGEARR